jgi:two-component system chemotaxis response regulator CheB
MVRSGEALRVLVVDDSAVAREVMAGILATDPGIEVAVAADPLIARQKIARTRPGVIVLDLDMPRMDGMTFLREIMRTDPIPVVVCSGLTDRPEIALRALDEGAVDIVSRPRLGISEFLRDSALLLIDAVRGASHARVGRRLAPAPPRHSADAVLPPPMPVVAPPDQPIVAIGASTGGVEALHALLEPLPQDTCGIVIAQHMPADFTHAFARRLNERCAIEVKEASRGDRVQRGRALIAPGDRHMTIVQVEGGYRVDLPEGPLVARHRPSVDVLFRSVASVAGPRALALLLTGMGDDGAAGMLELKRAGATTIAQDEASCVVFGMPKEAIRIGGADRVVALPRMPQLVMGWSGRA